MRVYGLLGPLIVCVDAEDVTIDGTLAKRV